MPDNNITQSDMELMRQQAIERVNQMHKQSQKYINQSNVVNKVQANKNIANPPFKQNISSEDNPKNTNSNYKSFTSNDVKRYFRKMPNKNFYINHTPNKQKNILPPPQQKPVQNVIGNPASVIGGITEKFFPSLKGKIDSEVLIIVALIIILAKDGADIKLLIALGYLLI